MLLCQLVKPNGALQDERLTTASAKEFIFSHGGYKALDNEKVDSVSAALILESWMQNAQ